jgi:1-acyl-sn-glycerol-3-phosphate acyltransferase
MAKEELFKGNPVFAVIIRALGAFPVVRGARDGTAIERSVEQLAKGRILVIFPEGTRSKDGTIAKAKSGVALIAAKANVPVLPVCIMYRLGGKRTLDFAVGEMIPPSELKIEEATDRKELKRVAELIINNIKELQKQIFSERGINNHE